MAPIGWKHIRVPRRAPTSDTRPPNTGMELAITYAIMVLVIVQPSQTSQWVRVLSVRCLDPLRRRMKMYLAGSYKIVSLLYIRPNGSYMKEDQAASQQAWKCKTIADFLHKVASRAECW